MKIITPCFSVVAALFTAASLTATIQAQSPLATPGAAKPVMAVPAEKEMVLDLGNGVKMEMVLIKAGEFDMGSNDGRENEKPVHKVKISKPFYLGKFVVTVGQFRAFAAAAKFQTAAEKAGKACTLQGGKWVWKEGINWRDPGFDNFKQEDNYPVVFVSWNEAQEFCTWCTKVTGRTVRLPTEAEWEYACRAGTSTKYYSGDTVEDLNRIAWLDQNSNGSTHPVGGKEPNAFGLYDMSGNVCELFQDRFDDKYYAESPAVDPQGPDNGNVRGSRGGSWLVAGWKCTSSFRHPRDPKLYNNDIGFRVAVECVSSGSSAVKAE